jgi:DNA polymerase-1
MHYNCLDAACTYEVFEEEEKELQERKLWSFYNDYEMPLARRFHGIEKRGVLCDIERLRHLREYILVELDKECSDMEKAIGKPVAASKEACAAKALALSIKESEVFNLNAPQQVIEVLKSRGIKLPKDRKTHKESSKEEYLQKAFGDSGDEIIKHILVTRELNKILGTYVDVRLSPGNVLYSSYVITGTVTGRRSSRGNVFGLGTNHQNIPHHSELGKKFRRCLIARPGHVLLNCDQVQAEDWIVQAIIADVSGQSRGLDELRSGVDRHRKLASFIFSLPEDQCGKNTPQRFLGKKVRHAANYAMQAETMSLALAKEGYSIPVKHCEYMLGKFHEYDPSIRGVYHKFVENEIINNRILRTPHGRERYFLSARPYSDNHKIFREAYSYIPQSTVGDNTGKAALWMEEHLPGLVLMESHDAIVLEVLDNDDDILRAITELQKAFDIELTFPNGLKLKIPIEVEIGYNLEDLTKCDNLTRIGLQPILSMLREQQKAHQNIIIGAQPPPSVPLSSDTSISIG